MPLRDRAAKALRNAVCLCRPSRSPSPIPISDRSHAIYAEQNQDHANLECPGSQHSNSWALQQAAAKNPQEGPIRGSHHEQSTTTNSPEENPPHGKAKDGSTWYTAFKATVDLVVQVSDVFPPLQSVASGIKVLIDVYDALSDNQEEFERLAERLNILDKILRGRATLPSGVQDRRDGLARAIEHIAKQLEVKTSRGNLERIVSAKEDQGEVVRLIRELNFAIEIAMLEVAISNETLIVGVIEDIDWLKGHSITELRKIGRDMSGMAQDVANLAKAEQLKKLGDVQGFGHFNKNQRGECVPGSRVALLAQLLAWAEDPASAHAFWLSGMAGTGKTAVSETFCAQLSDRGLLGASFFCSIRNQDLSDVYHIIPTLAKALATRYPKFGGALSAILESYNKDPIREMKLSEQYNILIIKPAKEAFRDRKVSVLLCVDALDECRIPSALRDFLSTILSKKPGVPVKIFFTSRPETTISREVNSSAHSSHRHTLRLHDIEKDIVRADIKLYVTDALWKLPELQEEYEESWPPPEVDRIVERSGTLFIVAATIVRQIGEAGDPVARLRANGPLDTPNLSGVDQLYRDIMDRAMSRLELREVEDMVLCLSLLVVARRPLYLLDYSALLDRPMSAIRAAFRCLHSVVEHPAEQDSDRPIAIYHASFVDFLTRQPPETAATEEGGRLPWRIVRAKSHAIALERCLLLMNSNDPTKGLYLGVSGASTSYRSNDDQPHGLPLPRSDLAYACTSWVNHALDATPIGDELQETIKTFLQGKGLYWLEALSSQKNVGYSAILWELSKSKDLTVDGLAELLVSIRDFAQMFATPISHSAPHVYLSAIPFFATSFGRPEWWLPRFPSIPVITATKAADTNRIFAMFQEVLSFAVSPDGSRIAISVEHEVRVWNIQSGEMIGKPMSMGWLEDDSDVEENDVEAIAFSPDGSRIVSGSEDGTIQIWDAWSGRLVLGSMKGHSDSVKSIAFSADGNRIVSGSDDQTIRVWDAQSGKPALGPIEQHTRDQAFVAFSPDGSRIVSGSDLSILVWDAYSGDQALRIRGHTGLITSVAYSPDGRTIASGSHDTTVRLWDAKSGEPVLPPFIGHHLDVVSVAFSSDGTKLVSGSDDCTIRVWASHNGKLLDSFRCSPFGGALSVAFTPDGTGIVFLSREETIHLWKISSDPSNSASDAHCNARAGLEPQSGKSPAHEAQSTNGELDGVTPPHGHLNHITSAAFSPDGSMIATGSGDVELLGDSTVWLWDACNGQSLLGPMKGPTKPIVCVGFTPDTTRIVSATRGSEVHVWDALGGKPLLGPVQGHAGECACTDVVGFSVVKFSVVKDGALSMVCTFIRVWDVRTMQPVLSVPIDAISALSPDGTKIACGDYHCPKIQILDAQSGNQVLRLNMATWRGPTPEKFTSIAFSPDTTRVISGSSNGITGIWNVQSGELLLTLISGNRSEVTSIAFSPNGASAVSGNRDGTIYLWNTMMNPHVAQPYLSPSHTPVTPL